MQDMHSVSIPRDLSSVKTKFVGGLTLKQIGFISVGAGVGIPLFFIFKRVMDISLAGVLMLIIVIPFVFLALYSQDGIPAEKVVYYFIRANILRPKKRIYKTNNLYTALVRAENLHQEIKALREAERRK